VAVLLGGLALGFTRPALAAREVRRLTERLGATDQDVRAAAREAAAATETPEAFAASFARVLAARGGCDATLARAAVEALFRHLWQATTVDVGPRATVGAPEGGPATGAVLAAQALAPLACGASLRPAPEAPPVRGGFWPAIQAQGP